MSDSEAPSEARGGPLWGRRPGAPGAPGPLDAPSSAAAALSPAQFHGASDVTGGEDELYQPNYSHHAVTGLPHLVIALVLIGAAWWGLRWSTLAPGATDPVRSSEWWINITAVLLPAEDVHFASYSETRMWIALSLLLLAAAAIAVWVGRLGGNLRSGQQPFGSFLPLVAFPAFWLLPLSIGITSDDGRSRGDLLVRYLVAFGILFAQFLLLRWPLLNRIWRSGRLPYDLASLLLWLPMLIPWMMIFASTSVMLLAAGDRGSLHDVPWRPTDTMLDWARNVTRVTSIAILVLLVAVTISQHIGIRRDRVAAEQNRLRSLEARIPQLPPLA